MSTLLQAISRASGLSRRKAFAAIREGRVALDGRAVVDPSAPYPGGRLSLDGQDLLAPQQAPAYLVLHKPPGYVTSRADELGRRTVFDLVPAALRAPGLHSVGRLDRDTSGLLLLTTDGDLTFRLTHPRHEVEKEYWLDASPPLNAAQAQRLRRGIELDGRLRVPVAVERPAGSSGFQLSVTLREGRKRQVRRMVEALGSRIVRLRRVREGPLELGGLPEGAVRTLSADEVEALRSV